MPLELAHLHQITPADTEPPYRVRFRRNISLMRGCVKCSSPLLDMLVTRSRWSKMCRSIMFPGTGCLLSWLLALCVCPRGS